MVVFYVDGADGGGHDIGVGGGCGECEGHQHHHQHHTTMQNPT